MSQAKTARRGLRPKAILNRVPTEKTAQEYTERRVLSDSAGETEVDRPSPRMCVQGSRFPLRIPGELSTCQTSSNASANFRRISAPR